ncbi:hypothetical protein MTR67_030499, partial [Solanum verrucosum]
MGLEFYVTQKLLSITLETNSLALKNIINKVWEVPWTTSMKVKKINWLKDKVPNLVEVTHILREGNKVSDFFSNIVFFFCSPPQNPSSEVDRQTDRTDRGSVHESSIT